jgi:hypothetical protein
VFLYLPSCINKTGLITLYRLSVYTAQPKVQEFSSFKWTLYGVLADTCKCVWRSQCSCISKYKMIRAPRSWKMSSSALDVSLNDGQDKCHSLWAAPGSVLNFSCSAVMHNSPLSTLRISALRSASHRPTCTISHTTRISLPSGTGRRYVSFKLRLIPPREKKSGREMPSRTRVDRLSTMVAAQPPCRDPSLLVKSGVTIRRYVTWAGGPEDADSMTTWERSKSIFQL